MSLTFSQANGGHVYRLDGDRVPSVTTIIDGGLPKPALVRWAARTVAEAVADQASTVDLVRDLGRDVFVAALAELPFQARRAAGARGTTIHEFADLLVRGEPVSPPDDIADAVAGYARWLDAFGFVAAATERVIGHRVYRYAGRFDVMGWMGGARWLLDVKTSRGVYGDTALQVAAYASAEFMIDPDTGDERPLPHIDRIGVLHVQPDATELYDLGDVGDAFDEFLAARTIYSGNTRRRNLTKTPVQIADTRALF